MVGDQLSNVFGALADPTRRAILARLAHGDASVAELAEPFTVSQPAISRHLKVLERAGLVSRTRQATARLSRLEAAPLRDATAWLAGYHEFWDQSYNRLDEVLAPAARGDPGMTRTHISAEPGVPQIVVTREFDAAPELLFRAHVEPALIEQWLGPRWLSVTVDRLDARHGGEWRFIHRDTEGHSTAFHGLHHGDPSLAGIVRTYEQEDLPGHISLHTVTFEERGGRTLLRQTTVYQSLEDRDSYVDAGMDVGVYESMERLSELLGRLAQP